MISGELMSDEVRLVAAPGEAGHLAVHPGLHGEDARLARQHLAAAVLGFKRNHDKDYKDTSNTTMQWRGGPAAGPAAPQCSRGGSPSPSHRR